MKKIAVLGQGYVGLPLAVEFGKIRKTIGFDINKERIEELKSNKDSTLEVTTEELLAASHLTYSADINDLIDVEIYIVTVPTPIDKDNIPDLQPLESVSRMLGKVVSKGDLVIFESTVFPGATEEVCIPIIEEGSGLKFNQDFYAGYSPERINPGDKINRLPNIKKITSGSTLEIGQEVDELYGQIISAGTHLASSIRVAEAAKVIENTQRDLNIAVINEFAKIFNKLDIDTEEVLIAAGTKWNFLPFRPGLVGGHCISVDPFYLTYKAQEVGYDPEVILAGRHINDGMASYVATQMVKELSNKDIAINNARVLILGITFKGDCPDIRNSKVADLYKELKSFNMDIDVHDPYADIEEVKEEYGITLTKDINNQYYDGVVVAVDHEFYKELGGKGIKKLCKNNSVIYDLKYVLKINESDLRL